MLIVDAFVGILCALNIFKEKCATHVKHNADFNFVLLNSYTI